MGQTVWFKALGLFFVLFILTPSVSAHEQETLNVILVQDEVRPGNVTDTAFVEGNGIVFRMRDSTENTSMQVRIDLNQDGVFESNGDNFSIWLTRSCALDENGTLVDVWNYSLIVHPDVHEELGQPSIGDCFGAGCEEESDDDVEEEEHSLRTTENALYVVMVFASLGAFMLILSIRNERINKNDLESIEIVQESE